MSFTQGNNDALTSAGTWTNAQPFTGSVVAEKNITAGAGAFIETGTTWGITQGGSANQWGMYTGTAVNITVADNAFHAFQGMFNGASGAYNLDGTTTSGVNAGTGTASSTISIGLRSSTWIGGLVCEAGWAGGDQSAQFATINSNQHTRYGF